MMEVETLEIDAGSWRSDTTTWHAILQRETPPQARLIFSSLKEISAAPEDIREDIMRGFGIPPFLLSRMGLESNGFSGCEPVLYGGGNLAQFNHWSRFVVKQVYQTLRLKPNFVGTFSPSQDLATPRVSIHNSLSVKHGWEWYEMGLLVHWTAPSSTTIICLDLPSDLQASIKATLMSGKERLDFSDPYSLFAVPFCGVMALYDNSVWAIRDHICSWEAARNEEADYTLLHEIARHALHVSETLVVASKSANDLQKQHRDFLASRASGGSPWSGNHSPLHLPARTLEGLVSRAESNKARLQNEIQLAFHITAQRDSRIQVRIGEEARQEASAMRAIALITMTFLPATFVSSVFDTPFFSLERGDFAVSDKFWIYWALAAPLSLLAVVAWTYRDAVSGERAGEWLKRRGSLYTV